MALDLNVHGTVRLVPLRFTRAHPASVFDREAPDLDDRGYFTTVGGTAVREAPCEGPVLGICQGDTVRVKIVREWVEAACPLYVTSDNEGACRVVSPAANVAVNASTDEISLEGVAGANYGTPVTVSVTTDAPGGRTVIAKLGVQVYTPLSVNLRAHLVTINGNATTFNAAQVQRIVNGVNGIWRSAGIQFRLRETVGDPALTGFTTAGTVTDGITPSEFRRVLDQNRTPPATAPLKRLHIYFVPRLVAGGSQYFGFGFDRNFAAGNAAYRHGVLVATDRSAADGTIQIYQNDLAHEFGHIMGLEHCDLRQGNAARTDISSYQQLMFNWNPDTTRAAHRANVGYGAGQRGAMIPIKDLPSVRADRCVYTARRSVLSGRVYEA